ncbi:carbohydrate kinase family protein [Kriegella aquimaris]|uniref:Fructokinase n=1 Tax=Kriegella aquimaris TaxID=192904 RepID=A0A1G9PKU2_9FLAO|nr:carbohydrate kinase [Kriegella aquimaris]SDL99472.1 fructokinase [Kriegella aquimaris]
MKNKIKAVCFGEVLFDVFPTHSKIGGAPLNVCVRLESLGSDAAMLSSVGEDQNGIKIINYLRNSGVDTDGIQIQTAYATGVVNVVLNDKGVASYDIAYPVAWDKIELQESMRGVVESSDVLVYGSLVCRDKVSRATLNTLLKWAPYKIFDANLRAPHYTKEVLVELMQAADFIKLNDDELYEIAGYLGSKYNNMEQNIVFIAQETQTKTLCVTKGAFGAVLYKNKKFYYNSGYRIKVVDTVGSGDSFLASVIYKLFTGEDPQKAIDYGCAVGALVAGSEGANPVLAPEDIAKFMNP